MDRRCPTTEGWTKRAARDTGRGRSGRSRQASPCLPEFRKLPACAATQSRNERAGAPVRSATAVVTYAGCPTAASHAASNMSTTGLGQVAAVSRPTSYKNGEERPPHYLDYFHGALHVNPKGSHVLDDGWIWHPLGVPTTWSLQRWVTENPWESEDGPSKLDTCARNYY